MKCYQCKYFKEQQVDGALRKVNVSVCTNPDAFQTEGPWHDDDAGVAAYDFPQPIQVGMNFGCVHFEQAIDENKETTMNNKQLIESLRELLDETVYMPKEGDDVQVRSNNAEVTEGKYGKVVDTFMKNGTQYAKVQIEGELHEIPVTSLAQATKAA